MAQNPLKKHDFSDVPHIYSQNFQFSCLPSFDSRYMTNFVYDRIDLKQSLGYPIVHGRGRGESLPYNFFQKTQNSIKS